MLAAGEKNWTNEVPSGFVWFLTKKSAIFGFGGGPGQGICTGISGVALYYPCSV